MGACIGKKSSKYLKSTGSQSDIIQPPPQSRIQDNNSPNKPSPSLSKKLPTNNELTINDNDENRISTLDNVSMDSQLYLILYEQKIISDIFNQPFSTRVISITDSELENDLANLIYGCPTIDYKENPQVPTIPKSVDV